MDPEVPKRAHRRGFRRKIWIAIALSPFAAFLLGNLWLASPLGRQWIAGKITARYGLDTQVGGASLTPWNGVSIRHIEILQPSPLRQALAEPLCRIAELRLTPIWRSWLRGKLDLQSVTLDKPQVVVSVEMLAEIARTRVVSTPPPVVVAPSPVAANPPPATPNPPPLNTPSPAAPQYKPPTAPLSPTGWLHLENASFTLISASSGREWARISDLSGALPIAGNPAESSLHIGSILLDGHEQLANLTAPLEWQPPMLTMKPIDCQLDGILLKLTGRLGLASGLPLQIEAQIPKQKPPALKLPSDGHAQADSIVVNARFIGLLLAPTTWQADCIAEAIKPAARIAGRDAAFDHGSSVTILRGGMLSCVDARLIGDDLSLLGNATLLADGRFAGALRLVAAPEVATAIVNGAFPGLPQPPSLTPLSTPQRAAFDLDAVGDLRRVFLRIGKDGPVSELKHANTP